MYEQQYTKALIDKVLQRTSTADVKRVQIAFGEICEFDPDLVQKHWIDLARGTPLEHAQLHLRLIEAEAQCMSCFKKYHPSNGRIHCPHCGSFGAKILSGEEFHVESVD